MKKSLLFIIPLLMLSILAGGCTGRRVITSGWPGVTVTEDVAYVASGPHVYAVNMNSGTLKWRFPAETQRDVTFYAPPTVLDEDQLIIAGYDDTLHSVNPANGKENWSYTAPTDRLISAPLVTEEGIFFTSADHYLYGVDHQGNELWAPFATEEPIWASPVTYPGCECVYIASMDQRIYAVGIDDGSQLWKTEALGGPMVSKPALSEEGTLYVSTFANEILAIDAQTQAVSWRFETEDWAWASPVIAGDLILGSDLSGNFYAINRESGQQEWMINPGGKIVAAPLVKDDLVYFGTDQGSLVVSNREGVIQRNQEVTGKIYSSPAGSESGLVLVAPTDHDQMLLAFDENGARVWDFTPSDE